MRYFVLHPDGSRFGPADLALLNQWVTEGRIAPFTLLIHEPTGRQVVADQVPGIHFPGHNYNVPIANQGAGPGAVTNQIYNPVGNPGMPAAPSFTPLGGQVFNNQVIEDGSHEIRLSIICSVVGGFIGCCWGWVGIIAGAAALYYANQGSKRGAKSNWAYFLAISTLIGGFVDIWLLNMLRGMMGGFGGG